MIRKNIFYFKKVYNFGCMYQSLMHELHRINSKMTMPDLNLLIALKNLFAGFNFQFCVSTLRNFQRKFLKNELKFYISKILYK